MENVHMCRLCLRGLTIPARIEICMREISLETALGSRCAAGGARRSAGSA